MKFLKRLFGTGSDEHRAGDPPGSLTGTWHGHYVNYGKTSRIKATLTQYGDRISGLMTDVDTVTERSLYDVVSAAGLPPGTDEQIAERIYRLLPDQPIGRITTRSVLPEASKLEGTVSEQFVRFTKTYQGKSSFSFIMGDEEIVEAKEGHAVEYSGHLSPDGTTIAGRWIIYQPDIPKGFVEGSFELQRT